MKASSFRRIALDLAYKGASHHHRFRWPASAATCSGVEMPKPTASGRPVSARMRWISGSAESGDSSVPRLFRCATPDRRIRWNILPPVSNARRCWSARPEIPYRARPPASLSRIRRLLPRWHRSAGTHRCPPLSHPARVARSHSEHGIQISEKQQRNFGTSCGFRRDVENFGKCRSGAQCTIARLLDHRTIRNRIGKGHAEFDQIGAAAFERRDQIGRALQAKGRPP